MIIIYSLTDQTKELEQLKSRIREILIFHTYKDLLSIIFSIFFLHWFFENISSNNLHYNH